MAEKGRVLTGARARFLLNGKKVGYARNVTFREGVTYEPLKVLDNIEVEEHCPVAYEVSLTASFFRLVGETIKSSGYFPTIGANTEEHLSNILTNGDLTATIEDSKSGKLVATIEQVKVSNHNTTIDAQGVVGEEVEFVAIRIKDESEV